MKENGKRFTFVGGHVILNSHVNVFIVELQSAFSQLTDDVLLETTTTGSKCNERRGQAIDERRRITCIEGKLRSHPLREREREAISFEES